MLMQLTQRDLSVLERHRLNRLRQLFVKSLGLCVLKLNRHRALEIHCAEPWIVDRLMGDLDFLTWAIWIVVGTQTFSIYYAGEEIYTADTRQWGN
jgi:hypothetical protein